MKTLVLAIFLYPAMLMAQASPSPSLSPVVPASVPVAPDWLSSLVSHYPKLALVLFIVGGLRVTLKPLFSFLHSVLPAWGLTSWDQEVIAVEISKPVKVIYFLLDYLGSVKMPVAQVPVVSSVSNQSA